MERFDPVPPLVALVGQLTAGGLWPSLLAATIVGMVVALILWARIDGTWSEVKARRGTVALQAEMFDMVKSLRATEEALRRRLDAAERDRSMTRDELDEARAQVALLRHQRRRLVEMLRALVRQLPEPAGRAKGGVT